MTYEYRPQETSWHCPKCGAEIATGSHCWNCEANDERKDEREVGSRKLEAPAEAEPSGSASRFPPKPPH